jgi:hypothetical protein
MDLLFFISIGCFFALFVAALAIARHVRIEAFRGPDPKQGTWQISPPEPARERAQLSPAHWTEQDLHTLVQRKQPDWRFLVSQTRDRTPFRTSVLPLGRKPSTSVSADRHRPDRAYLNQDLGDLSDPYQPAGPRMPSTGTHARRR